jgi:hypothetical protein
VKAALYRITVIASLLLALQGQAADIAILNGDVSLNIVTATAGQQPVSVTDESKQLEWTTLETDPVKKIIVQTSLGTPKFTLKVTAVNVTSGDGNGAGEITLSTTPSNLVEDIPAGILVTDPGSCSLRYTAAATAAGGANTDNHTVTFTITDQ